MIIIKGLVIGTLFCLVAAGDGEGGIVPPGPQLQNTTTSKPTTTPTTTTVAPPTTTSATTTTKPTTTTTTTTTPKPTTTTTTTTAKPTTTTTTAKPTSTTTTKPTTPTPLNPIGKWALNYTNTNRSCLVLEAALDIDVFYQIGNATKNVTIKVPSNAPVGGACGDKVENLTLTIDQIPNTLFLNFKKSNDSKKYDLESAIIMLNFTVPGEKDSRVWVLAHAHDEFNTPVSNSYKCAKEQSLNLTSQTLDKSYNGLLRISHFQVQAFRNSTSTNFDEALDCANVETPDVVPIAVGCALAALVIIVLVAYLIGRRRSQARGYLSM